MIKVIIIDDEPLATDIVQEYLASFPEFHIEAICHNGFDGLKAIIQHKPDLIFLDIQMPKLSGFELLELLENAPHIIFTTAFDEFAMQAFEQNATDYLLKPFSQERFNKAIQKFLAFYDSHTSQPPQPTDKIIDSTQSLQHRIVVKHGNQIKIIPLEDLLFIEAYDDYVKLHTREAYFLKKKTMIFFEHHLPSNLFARVHRSFIVQISAITKLEPLSKDQYIAVLTNGAKIPLSKSGYSNIKTILGI